MRRGLRIRGTVQGVGFRPSMHRLATALGLDGLVRNDAAGVWVEVEGDPDVVGRFCDALRAAIPPLARIDAVEVQRLAPVGDAGFRIVPSRADARARTLVPPDTAPCDACLRELFDPRDRRWRYPFINCTACGPRYTIVRELPYDRARTTMAPFALCADCRREYEDPRDRRFHAEPNACPRCGPRLRLGDLVGDDALARAVRLIGDGAIVALKGVGGYLLAARADDDRAVARLRARKHRPHKPFALMARDLATVDAIAVAGDDERALLCDAARPVVLLRARARERVAPSVAPDLSELGVMLPSTPLHHLLLHDGPALLVMTSGNRAGEPIAATDDEARARLDGIADALLVHDRAIHTRADDSVVRIVAGGAQPVRRARGLCPAPLALEFLDEDAPPVLAVGAQLKNAVCLTRDGAAYLSPHLGDLDEPACFDLFVETIDKLARLLDVAPALVAHDLHPDYRSTRWALASGLPRCAVQHHHAHVAACLAEHGRVGPALGVAFDGTGCAPDGALWGGELLACDLAGFRRLAHLRPLALPGGELAIRQPWRLAVAALADAGEPLDLVRHVDARRRDAVARLAGPTSTGAGRWFDAVAALCALRDEVSYEGQAAVELDAVAQEGDADPLPFALAGDEIDLRPTVRAIARALRDGDAVGEVAARFYLTMVEVIAAACVRARDQGAPSTVALSGGCFQSARLTTATRARLERLGFEVLVHRRVPPSDGGLALGQAAVAAWRRKGATDVPRHSR